MHDTMEKENIIGQKPHGTWAKRWYVDGVAFNDAIYNSTIDSRYFQCGSRMIKLFSVQTYTHIYTYTYTHSHTHTHIRMLMDTSIRDAIAAGVGGLNTRLINWLLL